MHFYQALINYYIFSNVQNKINNNFNIHILLLFSVVVYVLVIMHRLDFIGNREILPNFYEIVKIKYT